MPGRTIQDIIRETARQYKVPESLALAVAERESSFNPEAIGPEIETMPGVRALGTFQLLPSTAKSLGVDPEDHFGNIEGGVKYLRQLLDASNGDLDLTLKTYGGFKTADPTAYIADINERMAKFDPAAAVGAPGSTPTTGQPQPAPVKTIDTGQAAGAAPGGVQTAPPTLPATASSALRERLARVTGAAAAGTGRFLGELGTAAIVEPVKGLTQLASTAYQQGPLEAAKQLGRGIVEPSREQLILATKARQSKDPLAWVAHMVSAIPIFGPVIQQASEMAIAEGDVAGAAGRAVGGLIPLRGLPAARFPAARAVEQSATKSMTKLLRAAGDGSVEAERALQKVVPLALDRSILRATKGRMAEAARTAKVEAGETVGQTLAGPAGDVIIPTQPVLDGLQTLRQQITNYVPVGPTGRPIGAGARSATALRSVAFNKRLENQISKLEDIITAHGPTVHTRQLVNLRRDWDDFVYKSKSFLNREKMKTQYEARAKSAATDAIRTIIDQDPRLIDLADVDRVYHLHSQLYSFVADEAFGRGHGMTSYYPGFGAKAAITRRLFNAATKSPTWRLLPISAKTRLARFMAGGNETAVRTFLRNVLGGGVVGVGRGDDDLLDGDDALIARQAAGQS